MKNLQKNLVNNKMKIPFLNINELHKDIMPEIKGAVNAVLDKGEFILGEQVDMFEQEFAKYCGSKYCISMSNGLDALRLALIAEGIGPGDDVIVPAHTFIATWLAVNAVGAKPVPVDIENITYSLDATKVRKSITKETKAIIVVHLYGHPVNLDEIKAICLQNDLKLIEDAAQAHGAEYKEQKIGSMENTTCWSFYPGKNLGAFGDGGAVTTNSKDTYLKLKRYRNYGSDQKYVHIEKGVNARLDEIQATILRIKLQHLDAWNDKRNKLSMLYSKGLKDMPISLPRTYDHCKHAWHLYVILTSERKELMKFLGEKGIQTLVHYPKLPSQQLAYQEFAQTKFEVAEQVSERCLSLPISPELKTCEVEYVIKCMSEFFLD